jgi:hypothetical protein
MNIDPGHIIRSSRIKPDFVTFQRISAAVAAVQTFDYVVPRERDFLFMTGVCIGEPTGGENVQHLHLEVIPFGVDITGNRVVLAHGPPGAAAVREVLNLSHDIYIPRESIIRMYAEYSNGILAKNTEFHLTGWLFPAYDQTL